ncbi:MAG: hypothetical protein JNN15_10635, partial [Blastocatellia bacterium]|nr:hypothetical protein [Blastocatellia bacterium]
TGQFSYNTYISADPRDPNTVYLGSRDVYKSTNGGTSWTNLNNSFTVDGDFTPFSSNAHPDQHCFAFAPNDSNTFYIGNDGGLYKSTDAGRSFFSLNQTLALTQSYGLTINPNDSAISYTGTQDNGLQKRVDSRGGWREILTGDYGKVVFTKSEPNNFFANVFFGNILKFSNDEFNDVAATSSTFGEDEGRPRIAFIAPFKGNGVDDTLYFGTWRLFVSTNLGRTWSPPAGTLDLTRGGTDVLNTIAVSNVNPNVIYVGSRQGRAMTSTDAGRNWRDISMGLPNRTITDIAIDRNNPAIAYLSVSGFGSKHIFFTDNGGTTWRDVDGNLPNIPVNTVLIDPRQSNVVYLGTDIGIFRSTTGGSQWDLFNNGLPPVVVMDLESHSDGTIQAATYGRSVYQLSAPSSDTVVPTVTVGTPNGGETINAGSQVTINWTSSDNIGVTRHDIALSTDGGSTFPVSIANGLQGNAQSFVWSVPQIDTAQARIRVTAIDDAANRGADASDNNFRIVGNDTVVPVVTVLSPNGGENIIAGSSFTISWRSSDDRSISRHNIDLSTDGGSTFPVSIASGLSADAQTFVWSVPQIDTGQARVRVTAIDQANNQGTDVSNANFNIANRDFQLEFAQPNITLSRRGSTDATLNIIRTGGFDGAVTVTVPADLKALKLKITPTMQSSTGSTLSFNIKAKRGTPRGTIRIAFVGRDSAGTTRQATLMLTVQ